MKTEREQIWTIRRLTTWIADDLVSRGIQSARLDAELLVAHALNCERIDLYLDLDKPLGRSELIPVREFVARRRKFEPVAYILGEREFYGRKFSVTPAVMIPRPDTETLIDQAFKVLDKREGRRVLDLCTGSGVIGITLAAERSVLSVDATDISVQAIEVARENAINLGVQDRVKFYHGDLFSALLCKGTADSLSDQSGPPPDEDPPSCYDLVVCNPPYIVDSEWKTLAPDITLHEPALALLGGKDGLDFYRKLSGTVSHWLSPGGTFLVEVGQGQAHLVMSLITADPHVTEIHTHKDLGGIERVIEARYGDASS